MPRQETSGGLDRIRMACCLAAGVLAPSWGGVHAVPMHQWSQRYGDTSHQNVGGVATDGSGNVIAVGSFEGTADFGGGPLVSVDARDIFVVKLSATGAHLWTRQYGGTGLQSAQAVATDAAGNVFVTGEMEGTVDFGGGGLASAGARDIFVLALDPGGNHLWSRRFGGTNDDMGYSVAVDGAGNVIGSGHFWSTMDFGGGPFVPVLQSQDMYVVKLDPSGAHVWSKQFGGESTEFGYSVATDSGGNVVLCGDSVSPAIDFGGGPLAAGGGRDICVAKFDAAGNHVWSRRFGDAGTQAGACVDIDGAGHVVLTGTNQGTVNFGGGSLVSTSFDIYVASFDAGGNHRWSKRFGNANPQFGTAVATNASGDLVVTGNMYGTVNFGGGNIASAGQDDIYLAKLDVDGNHLWSQRFGDASGGQVGAAVALQASGDFLVAGSFQGGADFGGGVLAGAGGYDGFVAKFADQQPVAVTITSFEATVVDAAVEIRWALWHDEEPTGFSLRRRDDASAHAIVLMQEAIATTASYVDHAIEPGRTYEYEIVVQGRDGAVARSHTSAVIPRTRTELRQNYPNPFNPTTTIEYRLAQRTGVVLCVYDASGGRVATIDEGVRDPGIHRVEWNGYGMSGEPLASGIYFYELEAGTERMRRRMTLLK